MKQYKLVKIVDIRGDGWEYENCEMERGLFNIVIKLKSENTTDVHISFPNSSVISVMTVSGD